MGSINKIIAQLETVKNTVKAPDNPSLVVAVASISDSLERFCGAVYYALHEIGEDNEVIKVRFFAGYHVKRPDLF